MRRLAVAVTALSLVTLAACGGSSSSVSSDTAANSSATDVSGTGNDCTSGKTLSDGKLVIGTGNPAYAPWVVDDKPESKKGFEAAVAYAVAEDMGFTDGNVSWVRTDFDAAIAPGKKNFDFNLQQFSITADRQKTVSFSDPYYTTNQAIVALDATKFKNVKSVADLKDIKFGAQAGTTSLDFINSVIKPSSTPFVYDDNAGAKAALQAKQIDAIVLDLPTAFYVASAEIDGASVVGQFPASAAVAGDQLGMVFDLNNPLTSCVNAALKDLTDSGELAKIQQKWLSDQTNAPVISL